jgi:hypothetical protein
MNKRKTIVLFLSFFIAGTLILNTSILFAQAQVYDDNRYGYDNNDHPKVSSDIQKIQCISSNINVNGIHITEIPQDDIATTVAANEAGPDGPNTQNGDGFDKINFDRNLVNICVNVNSNDQIISPRNLDLAVANEFDDSVSILLGNGDGTFGPKTDFGVGSIPRSVAVGDFNNK